MENDILIDIDDLLSLMLAGNFTFTAKSLRTGHHYTYQIKKSDDYEEEFTYEIIPDVGFLVIRKGKIEYDLPEKRKDEKLVQVFTVVFNLMKLGRKHPQLELYRSIKCAACGRKLTDDESIKIGVGPECRKKNVELLTRIDKITQNG